MYGMFLAPLLVSVLAPSTMQAPNAAGEEELAKLLEGRVAGAPVACVELPRRREVITGTAIVYRAASGTRLYVNRPASTTLVNKNSNLMRYATQRVRHLCNGDTLQASDTGIWQPKGLIELGAFVPYDKVETSAR